MDKVTGPLLKTKLFVPPRRTNLITRQHLLDLMDEALRSQQRLTLISARAGSGKTTLVSEWLRQQECPFAWITLDARDNVSGQFFNYLVESLRQLDLPFSRNITNGHEFHSVEMLITEVINGIASRSTPIILVLDDYHSIQKDEIHKAVTFLIEHQPPQMHLVITTRVDPPLPLAQLRARGQLNELRDRELLFSKDEAIHFFNKVMDLDLPEGVIAAIEQRTEGWIAGLQMAAISARGHKQDGDLGAFIEAFGGTSRFIMDYLTDEVLNQQPQQIQDFLIETSILDRICGSLCDAVRTAEPTDFSSQSILIELELKNLFVIPLDDERRWYRYHHLFSDLLQNNLRLRRSSDQIRELHRRAARWYQKEEMLGDAMTHILAAQDFEQAAEVIDQNIAGMLHLFSRSNDPLLLSWIEQVPEEIRRSRPWIDVYRANMLALNLQLDEVESILDDVEHRVEPGSPRAAEILGHIAGVRAYIANLHGDPTRAISMAELAVRILPPENFWVARTMISYTLADTYYALDNLDNANQALMDVQHFGEKSGQLLIIVPALCELAGIKKVQGHLHQAEGLYNSAHQTMADRNALEMRVRCSYEFGISDLLRERNQLDEALEHAAAGIELRRRTGGYRVIGDLAQMRALQARGDVDGAMQALRTAELSVENYPFQLALLIEFKTARVIQYLMIGDLESAERYARECDGGTEREQIALARLKLALGRAAEALELLSPQLTSAENGERTGRIIEILALQSLALDAEGLSLDAENALVRSIALAKPEGYRRIFLDLGQPLRLILERLVKHGANEDVRTLLIAFKQDVAVADTSPQTSGSYSLIDPLSRRELEVLQLLAEGLSNKEIASRLFVAPGTIKQHLKNICRKLDARGRVQAVRRGQELKLL